MNETRTYTYMNNGVEETVTIGHSLPHSEPTPSPLKKNMVKEAYAGRLSGRGWYNQLSDEDRQLWDMHLRRIARPSKGGRARASKAKRDDKGRFIKG